MRDAIRGIAAVAVVLLVAGCASQLEYDLGKAEDPCHDQTFATKSDLVACLAAHERPVWAKDEPQTLDIYDQFVEARAQLAQQLDAGTITEDQYQKKMADTTADFRARVNDRRAEAQAAPTPPTAPAPPAAE